MPHRSWLANFEASFGRPNRAEVLMVLMNAFAHAQLPRLTSWDPEKERTDKHAPMMYVGR